MKKLEITDKMYNRYIILLIGGDGKELEKYLYEKYNAKKDADNINAGYTQIKDDGKCDKHIIWMPEFDWTIKDQATMSHEIFHLVCGCMEDIDIQYSNESEEAFAYYYGYIFAQIWDKLKPKKNKKKK